MPKLDPSTLKNEPADHFARTADRTPLDQFVSRIKGMLVGDEYLYAEETLRGILETVQQRGIVTEGQRAAIDRIAEKPQRYGSQGRRSQRYYGG